MENLTVSNPKYPGEVPYPARNPETVPGKEPAPQTWPTKEPEIQPGKEPLITPPIVPLEIPKPPQDAAITYYIETLSNIPW
jgi:hypothetical protein